jgi:amino acid adenylation domain-containing protein
MDEKTIEGFRLSPQQRRLWLLQQGSLAYHTQCLTLLEGNLNVEALKEAFQKTVDRHEILRTTFHRLPGMRFPVQVIAEVGRPAGHYVDMTDWSPQGQEAKIRGISQEEKRLPFDFERGPLFRFFLFTLSADKHVLLVSLPSLCADSWTLKNLIREISSTYAISLQGQEARGELVQYADFSEWQNQLLEGEEAGAGRAYWQAQDSSSLPILTLPFERKPSGESAFEPDSLPLSIEPGVAARIEPVARTYGASTSVFLLACWEVLLWHLTGLSDIVVGTVCSGRQQQELQDALGLFAKWLPVHCHFEEHTRFTEVLGQIHESILSADAWQEYFTQGDGTGSEGTALLSFFPFGFEFGERLATQYAGGVRFTVYEEYCCIERFKVKLTCLQLEDSLSLQLHYDPDLFQIEDIHRLVGYFTTLLQSVVETPEAVVSKLELVNSAERQQLLVAWNDTAADYPQGLCIHQLFESQVELTPDATAVVCGEEQLSYRDLNRRANQVAHCLNANGVKPGTLVGICIDRSLEMIIGLMGILKAEAAYVPLDPEYPKARLAYMLEDTQARFLLTQERLLNNLPEFTGKVICIDRDRNLFEGREEVNTPTTTTPDNLAYVVFTSGSTGAPKGVLTSHRGVVNYLTYLAKTYHLNPTDRVLQVASLSFDASVRDIIGPLTAGAQVVVLNNSEAKEPTTFLGKIKAQRITCILSIVPSILRELLARARSDDLPYSSVRIILASGENLYLSDCRRAQDVFGKHVQVVNQYGPTECTMTSSYYPVVTSDSARDIALIGRPIPNSQFYILNRQLNPVPVTAPGELYIGGVGLAQGYLNRPELTAELFIPNPFSKELGTRLYKTGDLARYLPDGNMELLGRIDQQVKIRGIRVELGEIEAILSQHPFVQSAVVLARDAKPGDKRLVAYVVPSQERVPTINELRTFLLQNLPEYLVPSTFLMLNTLPLTPNGKVDRQALPAPERSRPKVKEAFVAPQTPVEELIARIWAKVLGLERIGIHDDFFELGGHSLLAAQVVYQLNEAFLMQLPLRSLFDAPTVAGLARVIEQGRVEQKESAEIAQLLADIEQLSADEVQRLLSGENHGNT